MKTCEALLGLVVGNEPTAVHQLLKKCRPNALIGVSTRLQRNDSPVHIIARRVSEQQRVVHVLSPAALDTAANPNNQFAAAIKLPAMSTP